MKTAHKIVLIILLILILGSSGYYGYRQFSLDRHRREILARRQQCWQSLTGRLQNEISFFKGTAGIVVKDLEMNWEFALNKDQPFASASLVKVPIMVTCLELARQGKINLNETIRFKESDRMQGSGVLKNMPAGLELTLDKIIEYMIGNSDNSATNLLISRFGLELFDGYFKRLGLARTNLSRKMMDFKFRSKGVENYTVAADMALILEKIYRQSNLADNPVALECLKLLKQQKINDRIPKLLPLGTITAHKTGLERNICHDIGIVYTPKGDYLVCVLTQNGKDYKSAKKFIANISLAVYEYYQALP